MKLKISKKFTGTKLAIAFVVMAFFAGLNELQEGNIYDAEISFFTAGIALIGTALYFLGKKRVLGEPYKGTKIIENILLSVIVVFLFLLIIGGFWYEYPLLFVVSVWILLVYGYLYFARVEKYPETRGT